MGVVVVAVTVAVVALRVFGMILVAVCIFSILSMSVMVVFVVLGREQLFPAR